MSNKVVFNTQLEKIKKATSANKKKDQLKYITIVNIYAPKVRAPDFIKQTLLNIKDQIGPDTTIVGNFNIPLSFLSRLFKQAQIKEETSDFNYTIAQIN